MKKIKRSICAVLLTVHFMAWANWEYTLTSSDSEITFYHDKSTIRKNGVIVKIWEMRDYSAVQTNDEGKRYQSEAVLWAFNCREETKTVTSFVEYSGSMGSGNVVNSISVKESVLQWTPIVPRSVAEETWKISCGKK